VTGGNFTVTQSGTSPSFTNTGNVTVNSPRTWIVTGGSLNVSGGSTTGDGLLDLNGVTTTFSATAVKTFLNFDAATTIVGNLITVAANDSLRMVGGTVTASVSVQNIGMYLVQGAVTQQGALTLPAGASLKLEGNPTFGTAALTVANGFTNSGNIEMSSTSGHAATLGVTTGALTHAPGATFSMFGSGTRTLNADLINQGTFSPSINLALNGQLTNQGTLTLPTNISLTIAKASAAHVNSGTISLPGGTAGDLIVTQSGISPSFTNAGTISINAGRDWIVNGGSVVNANSPTVRTITGSGGTLNFTGTFTNNGVIAPGGVGVAGTLTYTGAFSPGSAGSINIDLGGASFPSYDRLVVTTSATLAGTMNVALIGSYFVGSGLPHDVITSTSMTSSMVLGTKPASCSGAVSGTSYRLTC
jgi:hypothetical protein